jgi:hypothetical protein
VTAGPLGQVNYITSGLTIKMITPATTNVFTLTPASLTVHATTTYTLTFTFAVPHQAGDYFCLSIDPTMAYSGLTCSAVAGIASVTCAAYNSTTVNVTLGAIPLGTAQISISSIQNYQVSSTSISFQVYFYNSNNYAMETTPAVSETYTADTLTATINYNNQIALY